MLDPALLPQRVPAAPDVPDVAGADEPRTDSSTEAPQLARIANQLRRGDVPPEQAPTEGLDVDAVLDAVRAVVGVRAAALRTNPTGIHTLRLDLADDADPGEVSRVVLRLLQERMGLSAAPPPHAPYAGEPARASEPAQPGQRLTGQAPARAGAAGQPRVGAGGAPVSPPPVDQPEQGRPGSPAARPGPQVEIDRVQVNRFGLDATVEVRLAAGPRRALGLASGPAVDGYVVRLAAVSAAKAIDELLREVTEPDAEPDASSSRCFVEHTGVVPFGTTEVAVVVVLLVCGGAVEQLAGSALVEGDARQAVVRATLSAVNRRLDSLLT